ncbi:MAG TPA: 5'(3')-deoxyribonucleotidase [Cytophagales bacterium]|nr:5'(3')-deoxyribonucleotidase [Cytophagales bacterium]HAP58835.1 5'(3')-deoxyribonucleotidase [Cytophagales bacterium]
MKQRMIIDMDEVMADTIAKLVRVMELETGLTVNEEAIQGKGLWEGYPDGYRQSLTGILHRKGFFEDLPVYPNAVPVMRELNEKYEVFIVSAAMEFPNSLQDKYNWLGVHFPFLTWHQIALTGSKSLVHGDIMIDDRTKNLDPFPGKGYLYTAHHNLGITEYPRVNNWEEIGNEFL